MVDFRYHLVSLISVFLALAIGVVLGAGPLQTPIASGLSGQVASLREEQAQTTEQIQAARVEIADRNKWINAVAEDVLPGSLTGHQVALITMENTRSQDVEAITSLITIAGGEVNQLVSLNPAWTDTAMAQYRNSLSSAVLDHLSSAPARDASASKILSTALLDVLTRSGEESTIVRQILTDSQTPLVSFNQEATTSNAVIIIGPTPMTLIGTDSNASGETTPEPSPSANLADEDEGTSPSATVQIDPMTLSDLAGVMATAANSAVVVGSAATENDLVSIVRAVNTAVTTVDSVGSGMSNASAVLALSTAQAQTRSFGFAAEAQAVIPPLPKTN